MELVAGQEWLEMMGNSNWKHKVHNFSTALMWKEEDDLFLHSTKEGEL